MRLVFSWQSVVFAGLTLFAACAPGDHPATPDQPASTLSTLRPAAVAGNGTILLEEAFEDNAFASRGWYDNTSLGTTTAQHVAGSTRALEVHFLPGAITPTSGGAARHLFPASPTLYVSYWVKYSANWVGSGTAYHPHEFLVLSDQDGDWDAPANNWLTLYLEHNYQNGGVPRMALQDNKAINTSLGALPLNLIGRTESRSVGGCNGVAEANVVATCFNMPPWYNDKELFPATVSFRPSAGPGYKGDWNHVEAYYQLNSVIGGIGQPDGVMQYWFNGALVIDRHDIFFRTGARPNIQFRQFLIAPYIGDGSPADQSMWVDNLTLATARLAGTPVDSTLVPVASVTVTPAAVSQGAGATQQLVVTLKDSLGNTLTGRSVSWTSSAPGVATVDASGLETGVGAGAATITAVSEGRSGTVAITVVAARPGTVTGLTVAAVTNNSATLSFTEVNDGTGKPASYDIRWVAGSLSWATAKAVTQGTCVVPVAGTAIGATRTCTVLGLVPSTRYQFQLVPFRGTLNVNAVFGALSNVATGTTAAGALAPVATVTVGPTSPSLSVGATQQLSVILRDASGNTLTGRTITWTSSTPLVASVSGAGLVTGLLAGAATITATSEGVSGTAAITVTVQAPPPPPPPPSPSPVASVTVSPTSASLSVGATRQLAAALKDASGATLTARPVTWASSSPSVATVGSNGLVAGVVAGTATVTATSEGKSGSATVTVTATATNPGTVTNLAVVGTTANSVTLSFTEVNDGTGQPAKYDIRQASGALSWATATAVTQGTCQTPVAGTAIGAVRTCTVLGLTASRSYQFQLVTFRGTLNVNAVFGGLSNVANGTTTGGTVAPVAALTLSPLSASVVVGGTQQVTAILRDASGNVLTGRTINWASSALLVATVSAGGLVTGATTGTATITATSEGVIGTSTVTVTAAPPPPPPPPPPVGGNWPNEPAGWTTITDYGFNDVIPTGADVGISAGWSVVNGNGRVTRVTDATAPMSPSNVARIFYPAGFGAGSEPGTLYYPRSGTKDHYVGYEFKLSDPYSNQSVGTKQWYPYSATGNYFMLFSNSGKMWLYVQADGSHGGAYNLSGNVSNPTVTLGVWHRLEVLQRYPSSSSTNDGIFRWWIDGVLCGNYTNIGWNTSSTYQELRFAPTWGGIGGSVAFDTYWQIDHVHISRP